MLYAILKIPAWIAIHIFCKKIIIANKKLLQHQGPLLLACNHPNSFLDAIILDILFKKPVYSLARGDSFNKKWAARLLPKLKILPVYREREGTEHLHKNYHTFDACIEIFKQNGIVLIFSEALCINEWHLRPLKKGTARLCMQAWQQNIPLQVLPIGINYSSFLFFSKTVFVNMGNPISNTDITNYALANGSTINEITGSIESQLKSLVFEIGESDKTSLQKQFATPVSYRKKTLLFLPAIIGFILHLPLYYPTQKFVYKKAFGSGHYDSVMFGALLILYPFYLFLLGIILSTVLGINWLWLLPLLPATVWCYSQWKPVRTI